jgi:decaprenylphospho-beta-D-erythro-pentofuranosid-2-ulose 2-reductase
MSAQKTMLLLGATSDIGRATALRYAQADWRVVLAGRNIEGVRRNAQDISTRTGNTIEATELDVLKTGGLQGFVDNSSPVPDTVICVIGELGSQLQGQTDLACATCTMRANFEGPALLLGLFAERFVARGSGTIVGVSSVAGERGRASNYIYGAAKAGFTAFLSGLRARLAPTGVRVVTVKPGFVRTQMTAHMALPPLLTAEPEEVARAIYVAAEQTKRDVIYVRPIWRLIMAIIRIIPEPIFKRLKL